MLNSQNIIAVNGSAIFITIVIFNLIMYFSRYEYETIGLRLIYAIAIYVIAIYLPVYQNGITLVMLFRGICSDFSITTCILLGGILIKDIIAKKTKKGLNIYFSLIIVIIGLLLYLSVFGFLSIDIYDLGYAPNNWILCGFIVLELFLYYYARIYSWIWLIALITFFFKLQYSDNLWDYLFDPILWIGAITSLFLRK